MLAVRRCDRAIGDILAAYNLLISLTPSSAFASTATYDANGFPRFSILTMHDSNIFGPRLNLYCQQCGKRYEID